MSIQSERTLVGPFSLPEVLAGAAALAAVFASALGFIPGLYRDRAVVIPQTHGYDVGNLIAAAFLGIGLIWSARGSARGRVLAVGALACLVYSYVTYAFLIVLNPATLLYIAVLSLSTWSVATGLLRIDAGGLDTASQRPMLRRITGVFLLILVVVFAANWLRQMGAGLVSGHLPADLIANGWPMNPIWVEDLGFALPLFGLTGVWLLTRRRGDMEMTLAVLVFIPLLSVTILSMAVSMALSGQALDMTLIGIFVSVALISTALAVLWFRSPRPRTIDQPHIATVEQRASVHQPM